MNQAKPSDRRLVALVKVQKEESAPPQDAIEQRRPELNCGVAVSGMWLTRRHTSPSPLLTTSPTWLNPGPWLQRPLTCCRPSSSPFLSSTCSQDLSQNKHYGQTSGTESPVQGATEQDSMGQGELDGPSHSRRNIGAVSMSLACLVHQGLTANTVQDLVGDSLSREQLNLAAHPPTDMTVVCHAHMRLAFAGH